jgi:hypothetical protein
MASSVLRITPAPASMPTMRLSKSARWLFRSARLVAFTYSGTISPIFAPG